MGKFHVYTQNLQGKALFSGKIYTVGNIFTRPPVVTVATNFKSGDWRISPLHHLPISSHAPLDLKLRGAEIHFQYLTWRILFEYGLDVSILCVVPFVCLKFRVSIIVQIKSQRISLSSSVRIVHYSLSEKSTSRAWNWYPMSILMSILSLTDLIV